MATLGCSRLLSLDDTETETFSTEMLKDKVFNIPSKKDVKSRSTNDCKKSNSSSSSYVVDYGPIRVRHRQTPSQTLATGRRSKDEAVYGDAAIKRELRRAKNRTAARDLKKSRDQVELDLIQKIDELEQEKNTLQDQHKKLEQRKAQLNRAVYNAKQAPLIPLVADMNIPLLFGPQQRHDLLIDLHPLLETIDEQFFLSDC